MNKILQKTLSKNYSEKFIELLGHMLETVESKRPNFSQLIEEIDDRYKKEDNNLKFEKKTSKD